MKITSKMVSVKVGKFSALVSIQEAEAIVKRVQAGIEKAKKDVDSFIKSERFENSEKFFIESSESGNKYEVPVGTKFTIIQVNKVTLSVTPDTNRGNRFKMKKRDLSKVKFL